MSTPQRSKILVLSLTRMGDIVQSIPFFRRLRLRYPESELHALVESCFADVAAFLPGVDRIRTVRLEDLLPDLSAGKSGNLARAAGFCSELLGELRAEHYDEVWNLTHTRPSMVLNSLLAGAVGRGVTPDGRGLQRVNSPCLIYFFATNLARPWCQFNLVDINANCVTDVPWEAGREYGIIPARFQSRELRSTPDGSPGGRIAIHAGASQPTKQWPAAGFRRLAGLLSARGDCELILVGGPRDAKLAEQFVGVHGVTNLIGRTPLPELAAVLSSCELLISNDSGPMHVAAAAGTKVLDVTVGSALGSETAPYGVGHVVVEPRGECFPCSPHPSCPHVACAEQITPEAVFALAEWMLGRRRTVPPDDLAGCWVCRTEMSPLDGMLELRPLFGRGDPARDPMHELLRAAWLSVLDNRVVRVGRKSAALPNNLENAAREARTLARAARDMATQMAAACRRLPDSLTTIENLGRLLQRQESRLSSTLSRHGVLRSLLSFVTISRASLTDEDLAGQARQTARIYDNLMRLCSALLPDREPFFHHHSKETAIEEPHEDHPQ